MNIFDYDGFRPFLLDWIASQPKNGRGVARQLSQHLRVSSVLMSQILNGSRALKTDYAFGISNFLDLSEPETDFFLLLVRYENSSTSNYKNHLVEKINLSREKSKKVVNRVEKDIKLSEQTKAQFYSHWLYSAVRLMTDIPGYDTPQKIATRIGIDTIQVKKILSFLVANQLCSLSGGKYMMAAQSTHLESDSPWIYSRQLQWRQKSMEKMSQPKNEQELFYTGPMVLSEDDAKKIHQSLISLIQNVVKRVKKSPSEKLMCMNIDWFQIRS